MGTSPTNINLSDTQPAAKPDTCNIEFQGDAPVPDPNSPGAYVRNASGCYRYPQVGGVFVITDDYDLGDVDSGWTFICNSPTPFTITFPQAPPVLKSQANGLWNVKIINIGLGEVTLDLNGATLDQQTPASPYTGPVLEQFDALSISHDGTYFWSDLDANGIIGGIVPFTGTSVTIDNTVRKKLATFANASAVAVALDSANVGKHFMCFVQNLGAGTATLTPVAVGSPATAGLINGAANLALTTGSGCALFFDGTNWKAVTGGGGGGGGMSNPMTTLGDIIYEDATPAAARLAGNTTSTRKFLRQTGTGSISAVPAWDTLVAADIPNIAESQVTNLTTDLAAKAVSPLTTKGDIWTRSASADARQAVGADGTLPQADSTQANGWIWKAQPYDLGFQISSKPPANTRYLWWVFTRPVTFPANFSGATGKCLTNPTATATFTLEKNGVNCGTVVINTSGVFSFTSASGAAVNFASGDYLSVVTPNPQDTTLSDVAFTVAGTR